MINTKPADHFDCITKVPQNAIKYLQYSLFYLDKVLFISKIELLNEYERVTIYMLEKLVENLTLVQKESTEKLFSQMKEVNDRSADQKK